MAMQSWGNAPYQYTGLGQPGADWSSLSNWGLGSTPEAVASMPLLSSVTATAGSGGGSLLGSLSSWLNDSGALGKKLADGTQMQGWASPALSAASSLMSGFMGMKQYQLAKDQLAQNKHEFQVNYDAQKKTTNSALADRQAARVASNPGAYQSVGDYMTKYGI